MTFLKLVLGRRKSSTLQKPKNIPKRDSVVIYSTLDNQAVGEETEDGILRFERMLKKDNERRKNIQDGSSGGFDGGLSCKLQNEPVIATIL